MGRERTPYSTDELEYFKRNGSIILSIDADSASSIAQRHPKEVRPIVNAIKTAARGNRQWGGLLLATLPASVSIDATGPAGFVSDKASLRFLSDEQTGIEHRAIETQLNVRKGLMNQLVEGMSYASKDRYGEMMNWDHTDTPEPADGALVQPYSHDTAFGFRLTGLESFFDRRSKALEFDTRTRLRLPYDVPTPFKAIREAAEKALKEVVGLINEWVQSPVETFAPDSLRARISANVSVNRAVIEYAARNQRGREATELIEPFLDALNEHHCVTPPGVGLWTPETEEQRAYDLLDDWFGRNGNLISAQSYFKTSMRPSDISAAVTWSKLLRRRYISGRGSHRGMSTAVESHGQPFNLFLFSMAMGAAFYARAHTIHEVTKKDRKKKHYSVFPFGALRQRPPKTHAAEVIEHAYGMMMFGNSEDNLSAHDVREYAHTRQFVRSCFQTLLLHAVKNRSAGQLRQVFDGIAALYVALNEADTAKEKAHNAESSYATSKFYSGMA